MSLDRVIVGAIVAGALLFLARRMVLSVRAARAAKAGCGTGCGCEGEPKTGARPGK